MAAPMRRAAPVINTTLDLLVIGLYNSKMAIHFPPLSPEMQQHRDAVLDKLRAEIQLSGGAISFARYMDLVLHAPGLGYYSAGSHKLGQKGDFVTAPEISPMFAKCLARLFAGIL